MPSHVVRCGILRTLHVMNSQQSYARNTLVIARTSRGLEVGEVLCEATERVLSQMETTPGGSIVRKVTATDENELAHLAAKKDHDCEVCWKVIQELQLPMDLVDIERVYGGERMVIYYLSEDRVDFRELVKRLASEFQTRIEMRQIGIRDEAKLLADYGDCGKPVCCNTHLVRMPPVSMRMAKMQKATLDPNKISGRCGRLKCCLRYEFDTYEENAKSMPRVGWDIVTANGRGRVVGQELLSRQLLVAMEDNRRIMIRAEEVLSVLKGPRSDRSAARANDDAETEPNDLADESDDSANDLNEQ